MKEKKYVGTRQPRMVVVGSKNWNNKCVIELFLYAFRPGTTVVVGTLSGCERLSSAAALRFGYRVLRAKFGSGKSVKEIVKERTRKMLQKRPDIVVVFCNKFGEDTRVLKPTVYSAVSKGIHTVLINDEGIIYKQYNKRADKTWNESLLKGR